MGRVSDVACVEMLAEAQNIAKADIERDLRRKTKRGHWAWYIFPTSRPGKSDPMEVRIATPLSAWMAAHTSPTSKWWRRTLLKVVQKGRQFMDPADRGRMSAFAYEWRRHIQEWRRLGLRYDPDLETAVHALEAPNSKSRKSGVR